MWFKDERQMGDLFDSVKFYVDFLESIVYIVKKNNLAQQTDEAEVTAVMRAQRVRDGESRAEMQVVKWAAEGTVKGDSQVFCDVRHT